DLIEGGEDEGARRELARPRAHENLLSTGHVHQPRRDVRRFAPRDIVASQSAADDAHRDWSRVHAGAHAEVHAMTALEVGPDGVEIVLDRDRRAETADGVQLSAVEISEQRHHAIAEELIDTATAGVHGIEDDLERTVHDRAHVFGIEPLGHRRKPTDVEEEDGRVLALAPAGQGCTARSTKLLLGTHGFLAGLTPRSD